MSKGIAETSLFVIVMGYELGFMYHDREFVSFETPIVLDSSFFPLKPCRFWTSFLSETTIVLEITVILGFFSNKIGYERNSKLVSGRYYEAKSSFSLSMWLTRMLWWLEGTVVLQTVGFPNGLYMLANSLFRCSRRFLSCRLQRAVLYVVR